MNQQKTKILVKNIATIAVLIGVLIVAYVMFVNKKDVPLDALSVGAVPAETVATPDVVGARVIRSVRELNDLKSAIASTAAIFSSAVFKGLEDFSIVVPAEPVGRENPFVATEWKLKMKAFEEQAKNK